MILDEGLVTADDYVHNHHTIRSECMMKKYKTEDQYEMIPLTDEELDESLKPLTDWERLDDTWIGREYSFDDYLAGVSFAKQVGEYAQKRMHHPTITIKYKKVAIKISSWQAKGVTKLDVEMAADFNDIFEQKGAFA